MKTLISSAWEPHGSIDRTLGICELDIKMHEIVIRVLRSRCGKTISNSKKRLLILWKNKHKKYRHSVLPKLWVSPLRLYQVGGGRRYEKGEKGRKRGGPEKIPWEAQKCRKFASMIGKSSCRDCRGGIDENCGCNSNCSVPRFFALMFSREKLSHRRVKPDPFFYFIFIFIYGSSRAVIGP